MAWRGFVVALVLVWAGSGSAWAQMSGADLAASGYFRDQDTLPGAYRLYLQRHELPDWLWSIGPVKTTVRKTSFQADAHAGVADYSPRRFCTDCHRKFAKDLHQVRAGITCVQCHRDRPIAGIYQYYSAMNPIRRHAYVCAKCHEGASPSFAAYVIHEPNPISAAAREAFPVLYYAVWLMVILAGGVFIFFIPFTLLWCLREMANQLFGKRRHA